jgi:hypothetical protein
MRSPLANYLANDSVNNKQQYTATNGNVLRPPEQETKSSSTKKTETFNISTTERKHHHFYTRVKNITNIRLNAEETQLLKCGLNYSTERPAPSEAANLNIIK